MEDGPMQRLTGFPRMEVYNYQKIIPSEQITLDLANLMKGRQKPRLRVI